MGKKIICFISFGISMVILLFYLMTTFMATGSDWKVLLLLLSFTFPFMMLGIIGGLIANKHKIMAGIFMLLAGIVTPFMGMMCSAGGIKDLVIIALPLSIISLILYLMAGILTFASKEN